MTPSSSRGSPGGSRSLFCGGGQHLCPRSVSLSLPRCWRNVFCMLGALVVTSLQWLAGLLNEPGHHKVVEGGIVHFGVQFLVLSLLLLACVGTIRLVRFGVRSHAAV